MVRPAQGGQCRPSPVCRDISLLDLWGFPILDNAIVGSKRWVCFEMNPFGGIVQHEVLWVEGE